MKLIRPKRERFEIDIDRLQKVAGGEIDGRGVGHTVLACWKIHTYNNLLTNSYVEVYLNRRKELRLYWLDILAKIVDIEFIFREKESYIYFPTTNNFFFFYFTKDDKVFPYDHKSDWNINDKRGGRPRNEDIEPIIDNSWYK